MGLVYCHQHHLYHRDGTCLSSSTPSLSPRWDLSIIINTIFITEKGTVYQVSLSSSTSLLSRRLDIVCHHYHWEGNCLSSITITINNNTVITDKGLVHHHHWVIITEMGTVYHWQGTCLSSSTLSPRRESSIRYNQHHCYHWQGTSPSSSSPSPSERRALPGREAVGQGHLVGSQLPDDPAVVVVEPGLRHQAKVHALHCQEGPAGHSVFSFQLYNAMQVTVIIIILGDLYSAHLLQGGSPEHFTVQ